MPSNIMRRTILIRNGLFVDFFLAVMIHRPGPVSYFRPKLPAIM